jgi:glutaredoxin
VVLYARGWSWRCWRIRRLLVRAGYRFEEVDLADGGLRHALRRKARDARRGAAPYVFVDDRPVGGFGDVLALHDSGDLERLVRGEV